MVRLFLTGAWGTIGSNQQRESGEKKLAGRVIDHIHLAGIKPGLQRVEWQVQLEYAGLAVARIQLSQFDHGAFEDFGFSAEEGARW